MRRLVIEGWWRRYTESRWFDKLLFWANGLTYQVYRGQALYQVVIDARLVYTCTWLPNIHARYWPLLAIQYSPSALFSSSSYRSNPFFVALCTPLRSWDLFCKKSLQQRICCCFPALNFWLIRSLRTAFYPLVFIFPNFQRVLDDHKNRKNPPIIIPQRKEKGQEQKSETTTYFVA